MGHQCRRFVFCLLFILKKNHFRLNGDRFSTTGHWLFTELLMPALINGAKNGSDKCARVITTSSSSAYVCNKVDYATLRDGPKRRKMGTEALYNQSKFVRLIIAALVSVDVDIQFFSDREMQLLQRK